MKRPEGFDHSDSSRTASSKHQEAPGKSRLRFFHTKNRNQEKESTPRMGRNRDSLSPKQELRRLERRQKKVERQEIRKFTRNQRRRKIWFWSSAATVIVFVSALGIAIFSPLFAVRNIEIVGAERLNATDVEQSLNHHLSVPLPLLDRGQIAEDLAAFPVIESYFVESVLPDTLRVFLIERTPVLMYQTGNEYRLLDAAGIVLEHFTKPDSDYPLLILDDDTDFEEGFFPSVQVLRALPESLFSEVSQISANSHDSVTLSLKKSQKVIVWGDSSQPQLKSRVLKELLESVPRGKIYDVSSPNLPSVK